MVIDHMRTGKTLMSFAVSIGTYRELLYDWADKHPEFRHACKKGQQLSQQWWEDFAEQATTGRIYDKANKGKYDKHNPKLLQWLMSRRFRDYNAPKEENGGNNTINIKLSYDKDDL